MLKGVDRRIAPDLLRDLARLGHHDTILVTDGNFPTRRLDCPVHHLALPVAEIVAILVGLVPLETASADCAVTRSDGPGATLSPEQARVAELISAAEPGFPGLATPPIDEFLARTRDLALAVVSPDAGPSCFILRRGVLSD